MKRSLGNGLTIGKTKTKKQNTHNQRNPLGSRRCSGEWMGGQRSTKCRLPWHISPDSILLKRRHDYYKDEFRWPAPLVKIPACMRQTRGERRTLVPAGLQKKETSSVSAKRSVCTRFGLNAKPYEMILSRKINFPEVSDVHWNSYI